MHMNSSLIKEQLVVTKQSISSLLQERESSEAIPLCQGLIQRFHSKGLVPELNEFLLKEQIQKTKQIFKGFAAVEESKKYLDRKFDALVKMAKPEEIYTSLLKEKVVREPGPRLADVPHRELLKARNFNAQRELLSREFTALEFLSKDCKELKEMKAAASKLEAVFQEAKQLDLKLGMAYQSAISLKDMREETPDYLGTIDSKIPLLQNHITSYDPAKQEEIRQIIQNLKTSIAKARTTEKTWLEVTENLQNTFGLSFSPLSYSFRSSLRESLTSLEKLEMKFLHFQELEEKFQKGNFKNLSFGDFLEVTEPLYNRFKEIIQSKLAPLHSAGFSFQKIAEAKRYKKELKKFLEEVRSLNTLNVRELKTTLKEDARSLFAQFISWIQSLFSPVQRSREYQPYRNED